jgi:hypothetical protein
MKQVTLDPDALRYRPRLRQAHAARLSSACRTRPESTAELD